MFIKVKNGDIVNSDFVYKIALENGKFNSDGKFLVVLYLRMGGVAIYWECDSKCRAGEVMAALHEQLNIT